MSLASIKTKQEECLNEIYSSLEHKEAIIPDKKNLVNVAGAIDSITGGTTIYTVTFNSDGGSEVASQQIVSGNLVAEPLEPIKDGFIFNYWALNGVRYDFSTPVVEDITLVAVWEQAIEYTELEYLESTGTQYVDTEICPYKTKTEVVFQYSGDPDAPGGGYVLATWNANDNRYYPIAYMGIFGAYSHEFRTVNRSNSYTVIGSYDTNIHTLIYNDENNRVYFDGVLKTTVSDLTTSNTNSIYLFAMRNSNNEAQDFISCRIMSVKFTDKTTGKLVGDFIPVLDKNNVACFYNKVTNKYHYNKGTGSFTAGPVV